MHLQLTFSAVLLHVCAVSLLSGVMSAPPPQQQLSVLVRVVDDPDPYYRRVTLGYPARTPLPVDGAGQLAAIKSELERELGGGIRMLVKNDVQLLVTDADAAELAVTDRLEVWLLGSGVATRAETVASFAGYGREASVWRKQATWQRERDKLRKMKAKIAEGARRQP